MRDLSADRMTTPLIINDIVTPTKSPKGSVFSKGRFRRPKTAGSTISPVDEKGVASSTPPPFNFTNTFSMNRKPEKPIEQISQQQHQMISTMKSVTPKEEKYIDPMLDLGARRGSLVRFQDASEKLIREKSNESKSPATIERKNSGNSMSTRDMLPTLSIKSSLFPASSNSSSPVSIQEKEKEKRRSAPPSSKRRPKTSDSTFRSSRQSFGLPSGNRESLGDSFRTSFNSKQYSLDALGIAMSQRREPAISLSEQDVFADITEDLSHYPLPIRLGVVSLAQINPVTKKKLYRKDRPYSDTIGISKMKVKKSHQYCQGYYLCNPPPILKDSKQTISSPSPSVPELPSNFDRLVPKPYLKEIHRTQMIGRGRSNSDAILPNSDVARELSILNRRESDRQAPRWKLNQYFKTYQRKTPMGTKEYRFHAYSREEACYWWGYNMKTLVAETLNNNIVNSMADLSILDWSKGTPCRVLDIGTGVGNWAVDAAKRWKDAEIIGLDLVPVQTSLDCLQDEDLQQRVSWVVANVLQGLPFPSNSFDYVHIRQLNMGVSEDKWANLLAEVIRVLTPDGQVEILETDWTFFGTPKEILTKDLQELLRGEKQSHEKLKLFNRKTGRQYDELGKSVEEMLQRRMIKSDPGSIIPFHLTSLDDVSAIGQGVPRQFPLLARSSLYIASHIEDINKEEPGIEWTPKVKNSERAFISRPQIGQPLPPHQFKFKNLDTMRMALMITDVTRISEARDLIWQELAEDKENVMMNEGEVVVGGGGGGGGGGEKVIKWNHFGEYEREMDEWYTDMISRADLENLLKSTFDWNEAATRMDNRINNHREMKRLRKMASFMGGEDFTDTPMIKMPSSIDPNSCTSPTNADEEGSSPKASIDDQDDDYQSENDHDQLYKKSTAILTFRTGTLFTARKKASI